MSDDEYTSLRVTENRRETLREMQKNLLVESSDRPHMLDLEDDENLPSVDATIEWLCSLHEAGRHFDTRAKQNGKVQGYASAAFDRASEAELAFDNEAWQELEGVPILYALAPSAHHWQIVDDEETDERVLADHADPMDISLAVFDNGYILNGGANPQLLHDEDAVDRIRNYVERRDDANEKIDETVVYPED